MNDLLLRSLETHFKLLLFIILTGLSSTSYGAHVNLFDGLPGDVYTESPPHDPTHDSHWSWVDPTPPSVMTTISYFIDSASGISILQSDRIRDAAGIWSGSGALVSLVESFDPVTADVFINNASSSPCGIFSTGSLGCAEVTYTASHNPSGYTDAHSQHLMLSNSDPFAIQEMTLLTDPGLNWYAGIDPGLIGLTEYDYMTVALHEFGHHLGVGHSLGHADSLVSPMQPFLGQGQTFRSLSSSDIDAINHLYGVVPIPAAVWLFGSGLLGVIVLARRKA